MVKKRVEFVVLVLVWMSLAMIATVSAFAIRSVFEGKSNSWKFLLFAALLNAPIVFGFRRILRAEADREYLGFRRTAFAILLAAPYMIVFLYIVFWH
ncbi:MAG: hypothetical protein WD768_04375 [Phycisphaeraceae bacterium]